MTKANKQVIYKFLRNYELEFDWNLAMCIREEIATICGYNVIKVDSMHASWWYSTSKTNFEWREPRKPFDGIGGKFYTLNYSERTISTKKSELEQTFELIVLWIKWYNKTIKTKTKNS